jgi:hypothetical protein
MSVVISLVILAGTFAVAALVEPSIMFWLCARLISHAEAVQSYRATRKESTHHWDARLRRAA